MASICVLIVDDDDLVRAVLRQLILQWDPSATVVEAHNGHAALIAYTNNDTDLIITDGYLPLMDGVALARAIRARNSAIPIILISGTAAMEGIAHEAGVTYYLNKRSLVTQLPQILAETPIAGVAHPSCS
jgi:CheY-like chemotaxis protein